MNNSYTQHIRQQTSVKLSIMNLLKWSAADYANMQYRMGTQYLQSYIPRDPEGIDMLIRSKIFWNWWKNQWLLRDMAFLQSNISKVSPAKQIAIYLSLHDAELLLQEIYPSSVVLQDSYATMITDFNKSII